MESYRIIKTSDGIEIEYYGNEPIEYLPLETNIISFSNEFNQSVDNLPDQIDTIFFGYSFNQSVDNLPNQLKYIYFGTLFNHPIDNLPDSVEEIRVSQFYSQKINKLPKSLKRFNVLKKEKIEYNNDVNDDSKCFTKYTFEPYENYYQMYRELEKIFSHVKFIY